MKKRKAKRSLTIHTRNENQQNANGLALLQDPAGIMPQSTKMSLQCEVLHCNFRTPWLRKSKAQQSWVNHKYSQTVSNDRSQDLLRNYMEETEEDIFEDDGEQTDKDINSVTITEEESWMKNYHLIDTMPWPQDEVAVSNSSPADGDTPTSSLDASATGDLEYIDEVEHKLRGATAGGMIGYEDAIDTVHGRVAEPSQPGSTQI